MPYLDLIRPRPATEGDDEQTKEPAVAEAEVGAAEDGWTRQMRASFAPVRSTPPSGCIATGICSRIGPCDRHRVGHACATHA